MSSRSGSDGDEHIQRVLSKMEHFENDLCCVASQYFAKQRLKVPPWP
jgi:hypothetical protein